MNFVIIEFELLTFEGSY